MYNVTKTPKMQANLRDVNYLYKLKGKTKKIIKHPAQNPLSIFLRKKGIYYPNNISLKFAINLFYFIKLIPKLNKQLYNTNLKQKTRIIRI